MSGKTPCPMLPKPTMTRRPGKLKCTGYCDIAHSLTKRKTQKLGTSNLDCEIARWATARSVLTFAATSTVTKIDGDKCAAKTHFQGAGRKKGDRSIFARRATPPL